MNLRSFRLIVLFWFVALQGLSPFLHAHVGKLSGDGAGFLHQHELAHDHGHPARLAAVVDHAPHPGHGIVCVPSHLAEVLVAQALPAEAELSAWLPPHPAGGPFDTSAANPPPGRHADAPVAAAPPYLLPPGLAPPAA